MTTSFTGFGSTAGFTGAGAGSGGGANTQFPTYAAAAAASIPAATNFVTTMGYYSPGDGGDSTYQRSTSLPLHNPGFISSHDGSAWAWVPQFPIKVKAFGFAGDGVTDDTNALFQLNALLPQIAKPSRVFRNVTISIGNPCVITPVAGTTWPHELHSDQLVSFSTTGTLPTGIVSEQLYFILYQSVTTNTIQISATTGMFSGQLNAPSHVPGGNYINNAAKGTPIATSGSQSGVHTMTVYGEGWTEIYLEPEIYRASGADVCCLGMNVGLQRVRILAHGATLLCENNLDSSAYSNWMFQANFITDENRLSPSGSDYIPQAQIQTPAVPASAPPTTVTLVTLADATKFRVNSWCRLEAMDTQGNDSYPDPYYYEYARIKSVDLGTGIITFWEPLLNGYRSTYPSILNNSSGIWPNIFFGPATIVQLPDTWDIEVELHGAKILLMQYNLEVVYGGVKSIKLSDCIIYGPSGTVKGGPFPVVCQTWTCERCEFSNVIVEVDKIVGTVILRECVFSMGNLELQSPSPNQLIIEKCLMRSGVHGTAKSLTIRNSTIGGELSIGTVIGLTERITIEDSFIESVQFLNQEQQTNVVGDLSSFSGGTMVVAVGKVSSIYGTYTGPGTVYNNPLPWAVPGAKVLFSSARGFILQDPAGVVRGNITANGMGSPFTVTNVYTGAPGTTTGTNYCVDTTLSSIPTSTFTFTASVAGTAMTVTALNPSNAVLLYGHPITATGLPAGTTIAGGPGWLTGLATGVYTLNQSGGTLGSRTFTATWPIGMLPNPCPRVTVINSTGCQLVGDLSGGPQDIPFYSYFTRKFSGFNNIPTYFPQNSIPLMGNLKSWTINVEKAYTGAAGTMNMTIGMFGFINSSNNLVPTFLVQVINLMTSGIRTITATAVTGNVAGDSLAAVPYWLTGGHTIIWSAASGGDTIDVMAHVTMTAQTSQGTEGTVMNVGDNVTGFDVITDGLVGTAIL